MVKLVSQLNSNADFNAYSLIWQSVCDYGNGGDPLVCCPSDSNSGSNSGWFIFSPMNTDPPNVDTSNNGGWNWGDTNIINFDTTETYTQSPDVVTSIPSYDAANDNRCGITNASHTRVVGGRDAARGAYPWIAGLMYQVQGGGALRQLCGGSLITKRHIVTAVSGLSLFKYKKTRYLFLKIGPL